MTRIATYDTTLRAGSQGEAVNFSLQDKLLITTELDRLGVDYIEGGYPLSNPKDAAYFQEVGKLDLAHARVAAFGMTRRRGGAADQDVGLRALLEAQTPVITIVGKTWDLHATEVLGVSLDENLAMIAESVAFGVREGREVIYDAEHFFDGIKANPDYALRTLRAAAEAGATWLVLCDTNGGALPEFVADVVARVGQDFDVPLGIHTHNDGELAVANALAAVRAGATQVQGTINGIGERCGNVDLVSVIANLALKYDGYEMLRPGKLERLTETSRFVYETANMNFRPSQAFVGSSAFAHKGGMHVHGVRKIAASYEHIRPESVGNEQRILISELSGRSNIAEKLEEFGRDLQQDHELINQVLTQVVDMENAGYQFEAAEATFHLLVERVAGIYRPWFDRLTYRVNVRADDDGTPITEGTVKVRVNGAVEHTVSEGDGPVNALDGALRKALRTHYPTLDEMNLVDYKVRVINAGAGTAARVRVVIESHDRDGLWGTVGVSENIIEASWLALTDAVEHKLGKDARDGRIIRVEPAPMPNEK